MRIIMEDNGHIIKQEELDEMTFYEQLKQQKVT